MKSPKKTFFLLPGFGMQPKHKSFKWLVIFLKQRGFRVVETPINWDYKTLSKNTLEFIEFFNKNKGSENYVLGFSYGAVIAFLSANIVKPKKIYLCSLSPDFKEDRKFMSKKIAKYIGKRRFADAYKREGKKLAKELKVPSVVFYGEEEGKKFPSLKIRCKETARLAKNSKLVVVKDAPHKIDFPTYIVAIKKELS
jgi:pimeloyl-ACP methyl ester carboxylesterase